MRRLAGTVEYRNVYALPSGGQVVVMVGWPTRAKADFAAYGQPHRIACIKVTYK